ENCVLQVAAVHSRAASGVRVMLNFSRTEVPDERSNGKAVHGEDLMRLGVRQQARLYEISRAFSELVDLDQLLPSVIASTVSLFEVESSAIMLLDRNTNELYVPYIADIAPEVEQRFAEVRFPADQGIAGWVLQHGRVELVADVRQDPRWYRSV